MPTKDIQLARRIRGERPLFSRPPCRADSWLAGLRVLRVAVIFLINININQ
jgi:hypothetical protein